MTIQLYNTLTRQKETFTPIQEGKITFYLCGPTVYNYIHIGNARSAVAFDTVRRYLEFRGYQVNYVSNFTDVDDKIIKAAKEEKMTPQALADKYIAAFKEDTGKINVKPATHHPRVMDNIPEIIEFIQRLIAKGVAYHQDGDVYFKTLAFDSYGKLSDQTLEELQVGASQRLEEALAERKENPLDFALWKSAKEGEISWDSPWGPGRPGWHIECSVMATRYLGDTIDIHAGGQDLQFPHHENEIAQSECATGHTFANYWMHNGFVTIGERDDKMSKSLGNFVLLRDLIQQTDPMVVRYLLATVHYRRPLRFDQNAITEATTNLARLEEIHRRLNLRLEENIAATSDQGPAQEWIDQLNHLMDRFTQEMDNDFQTSNAITVFFEMTKHINRYLDQETVDKQVLEAMKSHFMTVLDIFGLSFQAEGLLDQAIQDLIDERNQARQAKDFARADAIRNQLKEEGILLDDTPQGTTWKRVK